MEKTNTLLALGVNAREAAKAMSRIGTQQKNLALCAIAQSLREHTREILAQNALDISAAAAAGMAEAMQDRLLLTEKRIEDIARATEQLAALDDPIGQLVEGRTMPNGLQIKCVRVPIGVVGMIFESRPNVTVDAAALCLKSSNVCILRGGREAIRSNSCLCDIMRGALEKTGLPADAIALVRDTSRESALQLMNLTGYIDVLIPRGGRGLIQAVLRDSRVPVIETGAGNCHIYVDASADLEMAVRVCDNAKTSRPSVCNAVETVLVHRDIAPRFLPRLGMALAVHNVELRGCARTAALIPHVNAATPLDYATEFDDYILAIRVVDTLDEAIEHIQTYSTGHSEAIITNNLTNAQQFTARIDAAAVYVNASTRFTDGGEFGLGAEIGISTQKLHARGPMGLKALTSTKYIVSGSGQIR